MHSLTTIVRGFAISATLAMAMPGIAFAGQNDRAQMAIAEARGKISAGNMIGAGQEASGLQTRARASLNDAESLLSKGKKEAAIVAAQQAGQLADQALAMTQSRKDQTMTSAIGNAEASAASAQQSAAAANQQVAAANARADTAMAMATPAPAMVMAAPATTTTVTTEERTEIAPAPVVHKSTKPKTTHKTTHTTTKKPTKPTTVQTTTIQTKQN
jgi:hypothetical protein